MDSRRHGSAQFATCIRHFAASESGFQGVRWGLIASVALKHPTLQFPTLKVTKNACIFRSVAATQRHGHLIHVMLKGTVERQDARSVFLAVFITLLALVSQQLFSLATLAKNMYTLPLYRCKIVHRNVVDVARD